MTQHGKIEEAPAYVSSYLWNERLFGMKTKRLGPSILASEVIIPVKSAAAFIAKAKKIGLNFGWKSPSTPISWTRTKPW